MKRRDFLAGSVGFAGSIIPSFVAAQTRPCPPSSVAAVGGTSTSAACLSTDPNADWQRRISTPGVMWHHRFDSDGEVARFGNPQQEAYKNLERMTSGGPGNGPYLRIRVPTGQGAGSNAWVRPFAALPADANYGAAADPGWTNPPELGGGASAYNQYTAGSYNSKSWYGNSVYHPGGAQAQAWPASAWGGEDFWLSVSTRVASQRWGNIITPSGTPTSGPLNGGKHLWFTCNSSTFSLQELVLGQDDVNGTLEAYTAAGQWDLLRDPQFGSTSRNLNSGGDWTQCVVPQYGHFAGGSYGLAKNLCWTYPSWPVNSSTGKVPITYGNIPTPADEATWVTFLIYVKGGTRALFPDYAGHQNTTIKVWVAQNGAWRPIINLSDRAIPFESSLPYGWNCFIASMYYNGYKWHADCWQDYANIIFKRGHGVSVNPETDGIPAPAA